MSKKFKDTKFGKLLKKTAPVAGEILSEIIPGADIIGVVANLISSEPNISEGEKELLHRELLEFERMELEDRADARDMYKSTDHKTADGIANKIINWNLWILLGLVGIQVLVIMFVEGQVAAVVTGVVGTITGALINERNTVVNFFFGSSKGSKDKDKKP